MRRKRSDDAFGAALMDCFLGKKTHYGVEREGGFLDPGSLLQYFTEYENWSQVERRMPEFVRGKILDVGCGAGRHCLHLQGLGYEVVGMDKSPLAVEVAQKRGVRQAIVGSIDKFEKPLFDHAPFDSIIMMGHNLGLLHGKLEAREILQRFREITGEKARIIGTTRDPSLTDDPDHLSYQRWNRERGRLPGQVRLRIRHRNLASDWLDYLFISESELRDIAAGTGWRLEAAIKGEGEFGGQSYLAVLSKE